MILTAFILFLLGFLIKNGKMYNLIAGYNTLSEEKKKKVDIQRVALLLRNVLFGMALLIILGVLISKISDNPKIETLSLFIAIIAGIPYLLVKLNSDKYKLK